MGNIQLPPQSLAGASPGIPPPAAHCCTASGQVAQGSLKSVCALFVLHIKEKPLENHKFGGIILLTHAQDIPRGGCFWLPHLMSKQALSR